MRRVYPRIAYVPKIVSENGRQALAVVIPGSELRPHFAGLAYVRVGSQSSEASEQQFSLLIAQRSSMAARILAFKGKRVTVLNFVPNGMSSQWQERTIVVDCDQFYVTLQTNSDRPQSFPLSRLELNFDNSRNDLQLEIMKR